MGEPARTGASWPDFALALLAFAKEDPWTFVALVGCLAVVFCVALAMAGASLVLVWKLRSKYLAAQGSEK